MKKHVFLNGFMGAGKSKIGPILASKFACPFFDSDKIIEQQSGKKISDIFRDDGEKKFRLIESKVLKQLASKKVKSVIALGGGALLSAENRSIVQNAGTVVYLKSSPVALMERVKNSQKRPLLDIPRDEHFEKNLLKMIDEILTQRKKIYETADLIFDRDKYEYPDAAEYLYQELLKL